MAEATEKFLSTYLATRNRYVIHHYQIYLTEPEPTAACVRGSVWESTYAFILLDLSTPDISRQISFRARFGPTAANRLS